VRGLISPRQAANRVSRAGRDVCAFLYPKCPLRKYDSPDAHKRRPAAGARSGRTGPPRHRTRSCVRRDGRQGLNQARSKTSQLKLRTFERRCEWRELRLDGQIGGAGGSSLRRPHEERKCPCQPVACSSALLTPIHQPVWLPRPSSASPAPSGSMVQAHCLSRGSGSPPASPCLAVRRHSTVPIGSNLITITLRIGSGQ